MKLALIAVDGEGGMFRTVSPLAWIKLWFARPAGFCALGFQWGEAPITEGPYAGQSRPRGIILRDFITSRINRERGTHYRTCRAI